MADLIESMFAWGAENGIERSEPQKGAPPAPHTRPRDGLRTPKPPPSNATPRLKIVRPDFAGLVAKRGEKGQVCLSPRLFHAKTGYE